MKPSNPRRRRVAAVAPAETREKVLRAAAQVFAESGFRSATIREICRRAGANIAAVNYHFRDKESLYAAALLDGMRAVRQKYPPELGLGPDAPPEARLKAFVHSFLLRIFDPGAQLSHGTLILREMAAPTPVLDHVVREELDPMRERLLEITARLLGPGAGPELVLQCGMSVMGQIVFYFYARPVLDRMFGGYAQEAEGIERLADHIVQFSLAGFRARAARAAGRSSGRHESMASKEANR